MPRIGDIHLPTDFDASALGRLASRQLVLDCEFNPGELGWDITFRVTVRGKRVDVDERGIAIWDPEAKTPYPDLFASGERRFTPMSAAEQVVVPIDVSLDLPGQYQVEVWSDGKLAIQYDLFAAGSVT